MGPSPNRHSSRTVRTGDDIEAGNLTRSLTRPPAQPLGGFLASVFFAQWRSSLSASPHGMRISIEAFTARCATFTAFSTGVRWGTWGDTLSNVSFHLYANAAFAGGSSKKPSAGMHLAVRGDLANFPSNGQSNRKECVSRSTPEAEVVAADIAICREGIPALDLWDVIAPGHGPLIFHEGSAAMIRVCRTGKNPTVRNLHRFHAFSVAFLRALFQQPEYQLQYEQSERQAADIYTKALHNGDAWGPVARLMGVGDLATMNVASEVRCWPNPPPTKVALREAAAPSFCQGEFDPGTAQRSAPDSCFSAGPPTRNVEQLNAHSPKDFVPVLPGGPVPCQPAAPVQRPGGIAHTPVPSSSYVGLRTLRQESSKQTSAKSPAPLRPMT